MKEISFDKVTAIKANEQRLRPISHETYSEMVGNHEVH